MTDQVADRRFLNKLLMDQMVSMNRSSAERFLRTCLGYTADPVDLLYRLTNPRVRVHLHRF